MDDIIKLENIKLNIEVPDWKEAVKQAGELLLNNRCITQDYIESMINSVEELGPYIVIAPHIAIAHARPSSSVLKSEISLVTLSKPVNFGNKQNDPVNIVFAFSALENQGHLYQLSKIINLIEDEEKLKRLLESKNAYEVCKIINSN